MGLGCGSLKKKVIKALPDKIIFCREVNSLQKEKKQHIIREFSYTFSIEDLANEKVSLNRKRAIEKYTWKKTMHDRERELRYRY